MGESYDLRDLLNNYYVEIPIIQRDYAQGRKGEELKRRQILNDIASVIAGDETELKMDFVYGEGKTVTEKNGEEKTILDPLDGQQRLTTLWLVHWYAYFTEGKNYTENRYDPLRSFTYQTRDSSAEFCRCMCDNNNLKDLKNNWGEQRLSDLIRARRWFFSEWMNDPTIDAMLRTLSGNEANDEDCIESIFKYKKIDLNKLNNITFELLPIGNDKLPDTAADDLYIKMNSRGKALSDFENFKKDLDDWIDREPGFDIETKTAYKSDIDNSWTNVFWKEVSADKDAPKDFDPMFFSFINRYFVNEICLNGELKVGSYEYTNDNTAAEEIRSYWVLSGAGLDRKRPNDSKVKYEEFKHYEKYVNKALADFKVIFEALNDGERSESVKAEWGKINSGFSFIPGYELEQTETETRVKAKRTEMNERVFFYATCRFIVHNKDVDNADEWKDKYHHWMRVINNLVRNYYFDKVTDMINCIRLISKLTEAVKGEDIYQYLKAHKIEDLYPRDASEPDQEDEEKPDKPRNDKRQRYLDQLQEEKEKAELILGAPEKMSELIEKAEDHSFFKGTIRFLYRDVDGGMLGYTAIEKRFSKAKELFNAAGVKCETVQTFLMQFKSFEDIKGNDRFVFLSKGYDDREFCWKTDILCSEEFKAQVFDLFDEEEHIPGDQDQSYADFAGNDELIKVLIAEPKGKYVVNDTETVRLYRIYIKGAQDEKRKLTDIYVGDKTAVNSQKDSLNDPSGTIADIGDSTAVYYQGRDPEKNK